MPLRRIFLGILIVIMSISLAKFGEVDDAPGAVVLAFIFFALGLYLIISSKKSSKIIKAKK